eukprot:5560339-Pleurochrysis_carterae.AAC.1
MAAAKLQPRAPQGASPYAGTTFMESEVRHKLARPTRTNELTNYLRQLDPVVGPRQAHATPAQATHGQLPSSCDAGWPHGLGTRTTRDKQTQPLPLQPLPRRSAVPHCFFLELCHADVTAKTYTSSFCRTFIIPAQACCASYGTRYLFRAGSANCFHVSAQIHIQRCCCRGESRRAIARAVPQAILTSPAPTPCSCCHADYSKRLKRLGLATFWGRSRAFCQQK